MSQLPNTSAVLCAVPVVVCAVPRNAEVTPTLCSAIFHARVGAWHTFHLSNMLMTMNVIDG